MTVTLELETGVSYWLDQWQESRDEISDHRRNADSTRIEKYVLPTFGRRSVARITSAQIEDWIQALLNNGVGAATVYATLMILRQTLGLAVDAGVIQSNPAKGVRVEGVNTIREPQPSEVLSEKQLQAILNTVDPVYKALLMFCARTGARWEEVLGLTVDDLYLREGMATVGRMRISEQGGLISEEPGEHRLVELTPDLVECLREHLALTKGWRTKDWNWVFLTKRDHKHPLRPNFNIHVWRPALRAAGLDERSVTFHALRHTAAVHMIENDWPLDKITTALGHSSEITTRKMYRRWLIEREAKKSSPRKPKA